MNVVPQKRPLVGAASGQRHAFGPPGRPNGVPPPARTADQWSSPVRYFAAATGGLAWALLWFGLFYLKADPLVFAFASFVLFSPVYAALGRKVLDLGGLLLAAFGLSLVIAFTLAHAVDPLFPATPRELFLLLENASNAWIPVWTGSVLFWWLRVARRPRAFPKGPL